MIMTSHQFYLRLTLVPSWLYTLMVSVRAPVLLGALYHILSLLPVTRASRVIPITRDLRYVSRQTDGTHIFDFDLAVGSSLYPILDIIDHQIGARESESTHQVPPSSRHSQRPSECRHGFSPRCNIPLRQREQYYCSSYPIPIR